MQSDPNMASVMSNMTNNNQRENMEEKLRALKDDPELAPIMQELEEGGPSAMMKYAIRLASASCLVANAQTQSCIMFQPSLAVLEICGSRPHECIWPMQLLE